MYLPIKKEKRLQMNNLTAHLKTVGKEQAENKKPAEERRNND